MHGISLNVLQKVINTPNATHMKKTRQGKHKLDGASPFNQISARYQLWKMTFRLQVLSGHVYHVVVTYIGHACRNAS